MPALILNGRNVHYAVRRSARARRITLRVSDKGVALTIPARSDIASAEAFLREKADWLEKHLARIDTLQTQRAAAAVGPNELLLRGERVPFEVVPSPLMRGARARMLTVDGKYLLHIPAAQADKARGFTLGWLKWQAEQDLAERVRIRAAEMGVEPKRMTLRMQSTRWGSCTRKGTLSFNFRLIQAPPEVLDYVVVHELAHMREFNHSPNFWAIVATHSPDYKRLSRWLDDNGWMLKD
jgi:predicted metal-dependent hydrolase